MTTSEVYEKFAKDIMDGFQRNLGRGSCYCLNPIKPYYLIAKCILAYNNKHPNKQILIVVDNFNSRQHIQNELKRLKPNEDYNIKILSKEYINSKYHYNYEYIITCNVDDLFTIRKLYNESTFMLSIFTEVIKEQKLIQEIRTLLPNIISNVNPEEARLAIIYLPVEEYHVGVDFTQEDKDKYDKCTNFINQSIKIFGDLKNIEKCKRGVPELNISASEFRTNLAYENGWRETLDTTVELFAKIDEIYNPNTLFERACTFYNITSERRNLLTDNIQKIDEIINICKKHFDKRILIVSKRGEFAAEISKRINEETSLICLDYHDCIEDAMLVDDMGMPVLHKSGVNKGKPRIIKAAAISTRNLVEFNLGRANILSIKYSSDAKLKTNIDLIILTDGLYDDITSIRKRFTNIEFDEEITICYRLYCKNSLEAKILKDYRPTANIKIIDNNEELVYNEETGDVVI